MRRKRIRKLLFVSAHVGWFVETLGPALVAPDAKAGFEGWQGSYRIGFSERDSMAGEETAAKMKPSVLAQNNPAIAVVFPHINSFRPA
jgi:hypothetical protein